MARFNLNDRPVPNGSMEPRLNMPRTHKELNAKLGPALPTPLVRQTSTGSVNIGSNASRQRAAGLPSRFTKD